MSEPRIEKTESNCPVCGGDIVSVEQLVENKPMSEEVTSFHCATCGVMFAFPTPQGISNMMKRHRETSAVPSGFGG